MLTSRQCILDAELAVARSNLLPIRMVPAKTPRLFLACSNDRHSIAKPLAAYEELFHGETASVAVQQLLHLEMFQGVRLKVN